MFESKLTFQKLLAEEGSGKMNLDTIGEISNVLKDQANVAIERAVKNSKNGTLDSKSLHDARKLFDTEIRKGKKDWDSSDYKIKDALQKAVRNGMNNIVDSSTKNPTVSSRRIEVMHLIDAKNKANLVVQDYVVLNPIREAFKVVSGVGRTQYLGQILSQSARTVGAVGAASLVKGGIATTVVVGGIGFGITVVAGRVLMSRKARSGMLKLVTMLDKGIKSSTKAADKIAHRKAKREIIELISKATIIENKEAEDVN